MTRKPTASPWIVSTRRRVHLRTCVLMSTGTPTPWAPSDRRVGDTACYVCLASEIPTDDGLDPSLWTQVRGVQVLAPPPAPKADTRRRRPLVHGTAAGYFTHRRRGEVPCSECTTAHTEAGKAGKHRRGDHKPRVPAPCGTWAAYKRHLRRDERCDECRAAVAAERRARVAAARAAAADQAS